MAQFTRYSWSDASAPQLTGAAGSLITVLNFALVTGQGWTHPVATSGNIASYAQGTGAKAGFGFVLNDNGPNVTSTFKEAWATGYKSIAGVGASVGSGTGQFPTAAQLLTTGHVVVRKSFTADSVVRPWVIYADARTFYLFMRTGDASPLNYCDFGFGEIYSYFGGTDTQNCFISGRNVENSTTQTNNVGGLDKMLTPLQTSQNTGAYLADNNAGSAGSQILYACGDASKATTLMTTSVGAVANGLITAPNMADNSFYLAPMSVLDSTWLIRGRYRGLYHLCHPNASIADGSVITGSGAYAGKTFVVLTGGSAGGIYCIETSNTLDTN